MQKMPRHYAAEIIALPTLEQRRVALVRVPEQWRKWVKIYVVDHFAKLHFLKLYRAEQAAKERRQYAYRR